MGVIFSPSLLSHHTGVHSAFSWVHKSQVSMPWSVEVGGGRNRESWVPPSEPSRALHLDIAQHLCRIMYKEDGWMDDWQMGR